MTVHEFSVNSQQSTTLMWNNLFFGVPIMHNITSMLSKSHL
ncbi:hypothetical protein [Nostoc sphaeroides]|nr:hypothetical protein [Nostoc sphaeroides]